MGQSVARAAIPAPRKPIRKAPEDPFARAVEIVGSERALADRTSIPLDCIHEILWLGTLLDPDFCPEIERAVRLKVTCEELRPDLIWHRDAAGEVVGYSCAIDQPRALLAAALSRGHDPAAEVDASLDDVLASDLVEARKRFPALYTQITIQALLMGVHEDDRKHLIEDVYGSVREWTDEIFASLRDDADLARSDSAFHLCFGMLYDFDEKTRDRLMDEAGVSLTREWDNSKTEALWAKAQAIRLGNPEKSSIASHAFAAGTAQVADWADKIAYLRDFHGVGTAKAWDAESFDALTEHANAVVLENLLAAEHEVTPSWSDVLLGYSYGVQRLANADRAERMSNAAMNLLDTIVAGIAAVHDYQWVVLGSNNGDGVDARSPRDLAVFLKSMQELTQLLINLRDNMLFRKRELEA